MLRKGSKVLPESTGRCMLCPPPAPPGPLALTFPPASCIMATQPLFSVPRQMAKLCLHLSTWEVLASLFSPNPSNPSGHFLREALPDPPSESQFQAVIFCYYPVLPPHNHHHFKLFIWVLIFMSSGLLYIPDPAQCPAYGKCSINSF